MSQTYFPGTARAVLDTTQQRFPQYPGSKIKPNILVLHSTEGWGWPTYSSGAVAPNMTIKPDFAKKRVVVRQHFSATESSRALENRAGGVATNTLNAFQIEMVGTCDPALHKKTTIDHIYTADPPQWFIDGLADVVKWLHEDFGLLIQDAAPRGWVGPEKSPASLTAKQRMTFTEWNNGYGICGHQHVPENGHWDPGAFPIDKLLAAAKGVDVPVITPPVVAPPVVSAYDKMDPKSYFPDVRGDHVTWLGQRINAWRAAYGLKSLYSVGPGPDLGAKDNAGVKWFQETVLHAVGSGADGWPGTTSLRTLASTPVIPVRQANTSSPATLPSSMVKMYHVPAGTWYALEDSIPGLEAAYAAGFRWIDMDCHVTKDNVLVFGHWSEMTKDGYVLPAAFKEKYGSKPLIENVLWIDLQKLRTPAVTFAGKKYTGIQYVNAETVFAWLAKHPTMNIAMEMKGTGNALSPGFTNPETFRRLRDAATAAGIDPMQRILVMSQPPWSNLLAAFKAAHPYFRTAIQRLGWKKPTNWTSIAPYVDYYRSGDWGTKTR